MHQCNTMYPPSWRCAKSLPPPTAVSQLTLYCYSLKLAAPLHHSRIHCRTKPVNRCRKAPVEATAHSPEVPRVGSTTSDWPTSSHSAGPHALPHTTASGHMKGEPTNKRSQAFCDTRATARCFQSRHNLLPGVRGTAFQKPFIRRARHYQKWQGQSLPSTDTVIRATKCAA